MKNEFVENFVKSYNLFQQPIIKPILDTASIADINNSWAESLMSNSSHGNKQQVLSSNPGPKKSEWSTYSPPSDDGVKTIGKFSIHAYSLYKKQCKILMSHF